MSLDVLVIEAKTYHIRMFRSSYKLTIDEWPGLKIQGVEYMTINDGK